VATLNIYLSDELKARMEASGERTNWSEVARVAFSYHVAANEHRKEPTMEKVVERLRASKAKRAEELKVEAKLAGRKWASGEAEHHELAMLAEIDPRVEITFDVLRDMLDPEHDMSAEEFAETFGLTHVRESELDEYIEAFVEGAVEVYEEVEAQL
jgi:hypothetical protein